MFTVAQSHFWKKQKTSNNSILDLCPAFLIKVWVWASPCLYNVNCSAREHYELRLSVLLAAALQSPDHAARKDTHSHTSTAPASNYPAKPPCSSQNTASQSSKIGRRMQILHGPRYAQKCPSFSPCCCSAPVEHKLCVEETLQESRVLVLHCTVSPLTLKICKGKGPGGLLAFFSENYCWLH